MRANFIATFDFSALSSKLPYDRLVYKLPSIIDFASYKKRPYIQISTNQEAF